MASSITDDGSRIEDAMIVSNRKAMKIFGSRKFGKLLGQFEPHETPPLITDPSLLPNDTSMLLNDKTDDEISGTDQPELKIHDENKGILPTDFQVKASEVNVSMRLLRQDMDQLRLIAADDSILSSHAYVNGFIASIWRGLKR